MADCNTCQVFDAYVANSESYLVQFLDASYGPMLALSISLAGVWAIWKGIQIALVTNDLIGIGYELVLLALGLGILQGLNSQFALMLYRAAIDVMSGMAAISIQVTETPVNGSGIGQLAGTVEAAIMKAMVMASTIVNESTWGKIIIAAIYAVGLIVPFLLLLLKYVSTVIVALFRLTAFGMLSPYVVAFSAFPWGRQIGKSTLVAIVNSILVVITNTAVIGLVMSVIDNLLSDGKGESNIGDITNGTYLMALILAWCGVALLGEAGNIADRLSGGLLGSDSSNNIASGAKQKGTSALKTAASIAANPVQATARAAINATRDAGK